MLGSSTPAGRARQFHRWWHGRLPLYTHSTAVLAIRAVPPRRTTRPSRPTNRRNENPPAWPGALLVEAMGTYSNLAHLTEKYAELRKRVQRSTPRPQRDTPTPRSRRFLSTDDVADITHLYEAGGTTKQIGDRFGISKARVAAVLREQNVSIRRQGLTHEQIADAAALYVQGKSLAWLGDYFDVSPMTVSAALRRHGVQPRLRQGWT